MISAGVCAQAACVWEVTARKPGNVNRLHDFADATYADFVRSAEAIMPVFDLAERVKVGQTILAAIQATRAVTATNTNLGTVLLLAPLAASADDDNPQAAVSKVLGRLDCEDARLAYEAIRLAMPGGLGQAVKEDVHAEPTVTLREAMTLAADRDLIARQYANNFQEVFEDGLPALIAGLARTGTVEGAIVWCQLSLLSRHPDSLIARKRGLSVAEEASKHARGVLDAGWPESPPGREKLLGLDIWLREDGNARNPGTTADLVAASLFVALRQGTIGLPPQYPWMLPCLD
jgi:triphosphoribosyl-dephospho-CoA synthase